MSIVWLLYPFSDIVNWYLMFGVYRNVALPLTSLNFVSVFVQLLFIMRYWLVIALLSVCSVSASYMVSVVAVLLFVR